MAKKKIFSTGVGDDITLTGGDLFIAMHFGGGAAPTGWEVADGGTFTFAPFAVKPDFSGSYVRGAAALNSAIQGEKDHTHAWPNSSTDEHFGDTPHQLSVATPSSAGTSIGGSVTTSRSSLHTASENAHDHTHGTAVFTPTVDPIQHIPDSQVMEFITKTLSTVELAAFSKGTILGFLGTVIPTGWQLANGTNGTPNLITRFPVGGATTGESGSEDHESDIATFGTLTAGSHNHTTTGVNGGTTALTGGPTSFDGAAHTHTVSSEDLHGHNIAGVNSDTVDNLPPFREMPYIIKMAAQFGSNNIIASGVHIMYDPAIALPSGWSTRTATYDGLNFVGRLVLDPDFVCCCC